MLEDKLKITDEEIDRLFEGDPKFLLEIQKKIFYSSLNKALEGTTEEERKKAEYLECLFDGYPLERDGQIDHIVFLPKEYDEGGIYKKMIMKKVDSLLTPKTRENLQEALETRLNKYKRRVEPELKRRRKRRYAYVIEKGKKTRKIIGRWHLNSLEKRLVREGIVKLEGDSNPKLQLQRRQITDAEKRRVKEKVGRFYEDKGLPLSSSGVRLYLKAYRDMKKYLQLLGPFVETLFEGNNGDFIFLDRDARPLYNAAQLFAQLKGKTNRLHTAAVTLGMVPREYIATHHATYGSANMMGIFMQFEYPSYAWGHEKKAAKKEWGTTRVDLERLRTMSIFRAESEVLCKYLSAIGTLESDDITVIDMGFIGTAVGFVDEAVKIVAPEKKVTPYLFFSGSRIDGFNQSAVPHLGLLQTHYTTAYESFPKPIGSPKKLVKNGDTYAPNWKELSPEETCWIRGIEGEVHLGVQLVQEATGASVVQYLFGRDRANEMIRKGEHFART